MTFHKQIATVDAMDTSTLSQFARLASQPAADRSAAEQAVSDLLWTAEQRAAHTLRLLDDSRYLDELAFEFMEGMR